MTKTNRYSTTELPSGEREEESPFPRADNILPQGKGPGIPRRSDGTVLKEGELTVGAFTLTDSGLQISGKASSEDWGKVGDLLFKLEGSIQWLIGDWLVYGEDVKYGDLIARVEATGRTYETVRNYMVVCRAFELSRRRYNLSFGHYQAATALPDGEQDEALEYAQKQNLSVASFRKMVQAHLSPARKALPAGNVSIPKPAFSGLEKLAQRDRSTWKPQDKAAILEYASQLQSWLDDLVMEAKS
jgi:hypothetical protein